ncbi:hypothetical protein D3C73_655900 [compost metagenome]
MSARQANSHSASVGSRYGNPLSSAKSEQNWDAWTQLTLSTGRSSPLNAEGTSERRSPVCRLAAWTTARHCCCVIAVRLIAKSLTVIQFCSSLSRRAISPGGDPIWKRLPGMTANSIDASCTTGCSKVSMVRVSGFGRIVPTASSRTAVICRGCNGPLGDRDHCGKNTLNITAPAPRPAAQAKVRLDKMMRAARFTGIGGAALSSFPAVDRRARRLTAS